MQRKAGTGAVPPSAIAWLPVIVCLFVEVLSAAGSLYVLNS